MKILQFMFIAVVGSVSFATCLTSETLHPSWAMVERETVFPAPDGP